jgi:hypothetical protein
MAGKLTTEVRVRTKREMNDRINALGGYQRVFDAIAAASKLWPCKEAASGISISVFDFVDALDGVQTAGRAALEAKED